MDNISIKSQNVEYRNELGHGRTASRGHVQTGWRLHALKVTAVAVALMISMVASASASAKRITKTTKRTPVACAASTTAKHACLLTGVDHATRTVNGTLVKLDQVSYYKLKLSANSVVSVRLTLHSRKSCLKAANRSCGDIWVTLENSAREADDISGLVSMEPDGVIKPSTMRWFKTDDHTGIYYLRIEGNADRFGDRNLPTKYSFTVREQGC